MVITEYQKDSLDVFATSNLTVKPKFFSPEVTLYVTKENSEPIENMVNIKTILEKYQLKGYKNRGIRVNTPRRSHSFDIEGEESSTTVRRNYFLVDSNSHFEKKRPMGRGFSLLLPHEVNHQSNADNEFSIEIKSSSLPMSSQNEASKHIIEDHNIDTWHEESNRYINIMKPKVPLSIMRIKDRTQALADARNYSTKLERESNVDEVNNTESENKSVSVENKRNQFKLLPPTSDNS
jgi:hypothetical protein